MNRELDCELKIVGSMTKAVRNILDTWMRRHPALASKIRIRGAVGFDTLPREIADCDVSLHLKSGDWCPNAVLEAMAGGVPVVCSRFGGTVELVGDGGIAVEHAPFVHDDELASKAAAAIREVIRKHAAFSERARRIAEQSFSLERIAECYCRVLKGNAP
jgi:glycosyltransferase involved in cell wall biosynthesis